MKEKSISDDADELLGITFVLAFTNSLLTFCKMALLDLFCEKSVKDIWLKIEWLHFCLTKPQKGLRIK